MLAAIALAFAPGTQVIAGEVANDQLRTLPTRTFIAATTAYQAAETPVEPTVPAQTGSSQPTSRLDRADRTAIVLSVIACVLMVLTRWHRLNRAPQRPQAFTAPVAIFLLGVIYLLAPIGSGLAMLIFGIRLPDSETAATAQALTGDDAWKLQCGALIARLAGVALFIALLRSAPPLLHDRRKSHLGAAALGVAGLLLVWPMVVASVAVARALVGGDDDPVAHDTLRQLIAESLTGWGWAMVFGVSLVGPIIEEVMYRGLLQEAFRRIGAGPWPAIILSSVIFALAHMTLVPGYALVGLFVLSLGFGWAFEKSGRLLAPIVMHVLFNTGNLLLAQSL